MAEDDPGLRSVLERGLREQGYVVDAVLDGSDALSYLRSYSYEVAVLDWRMPRQSGLEVVKTMRARGDRTPVLMLTARDATEDRVEGLNEGADDYLVKPFSFAELVARVGALQRRPGLAVDPRITCGDITFDPATRQVTRRGEPLTLTAIETGLLELLLRRSPRGGEPPDDRRPGLGRRGGRRRVEHHRRPRRPPQGEARTGRHPHRDRARDRLPAGRRMSTRGAAPVGPRRQGRDWGHRRGRRGGRRRRARGQPHDRRPPR